MAQILELLVFLIPIYFANSVPVVLGGGAPLDLGRTFNDGQRMLGEGKTIRGFIAGVLAGTVMGGVAAIYYPLGFFANPQVQFFAGFVLSFGTMSGDAIGSFVKRRFKVGSGRPFILDSIVFIIVSLILVYPLVNSTLYELQNLAFFIILTVIVHPLANWIANRGGLKNVPW